MVFTASFSHIISAMKVFQQIMAGYKTTSTYSIFYLFPSFNHRFLVDA
jgi:hypothetical protein